MMNDNLTKEMVECLVNIAEQEILADFNKNAKRELMQLYHIKKLLPYMDLNSPLVRMDLQAKGILDTAPFVVVDKREAEK